MSGMRKGSSWLTLWIIITMITPPQAFAGPFSLFNKTHPEETSPLIQMAQAIDELEHEIDGFGSVVVKQPDIWGEARWTKYRQDYEREMYKEIDKFRFTLAAQVSEADSAFLLSATTLAGAASGSTTPSANVQQVFGAGFPQPEFIAAPGTAENSFAKVLDAKGEVVDGITIEPTVYLDQLSRYVKHLNELRRINEGDDTNDFPGYALNLVRLPVSVLPGDETREGYGAEITFTIEPEMSEALLESTFKDLVVNDILDQLSIPVLKLIEDKPWLAGEESKKILAFEERIAKQTVGIFENAVDLFSKFLQTSQKKFLIDAASELNVGIERSKIQLQNDPLIPVTRESGAQYFNAATPDQKKLIAEFRAELKSQIQRKLQCKNDSIEELLAWASFLVVAAEVYGKETPDDSDLVRIYDAWESLSDRNKSRLKANPVLNQLFNQNTDESPTANAAPEIYIQSGNNEELLTQKGREELSKSVTEAQRIPQLTTEVIDLVGETVSSAIEEVAVNIEDIQTTSVSSSSSNVAQLPIPPSQIACVFGVEQLVDVAESIEKSMQDKDGPHVFDVRAVMAEELDAAYRFLKTLHARGFDAWSMYCGDQELAAAIQMLDVDPGNVLIPGVNAFEVDQDIPVPALPSCPPPSLGEPAVIDACKCIDCNVQVAKLREYFKKQVCYGDRGCQDRAECRAKCIKALAWAILVDSAILNEKLNEDMKRIEADKSVQFLPGYDLTFYGPEPTPEACAVFNEYVRHRWPMHVFAIDPERQEQNVQDAFARRRETQLALALAFTNGTINGEQFNRFARRIDTEIETIALNRTVVGFSHGNETFGWRFYPRVQTPPTQGNIKAFFETAFGPHKNRDLKHRQLEPGPRELLAVIIMPSFIRYARMSSRSSWFKLTHRDRSVFDTEDSVRLGQKMNYVRRCKALCLEQDCFGRPGDARRLMTAVDQLETRLPLQDTLMQVPHENTIGGYRLFSEGVKALGPELIDYYGEPGINTEDSTELFLVGRRFNVNTTEVIAGGKTCGVELLSREVMKVSIPKGANTLTENGKKVVDVHLATAYGVSSSHLRIPVNEAAKKPAGPKFDTADTYGHVEYLKCQGIDFSFLNNKKLFEITGIPKEENGTVSIAVTAVRSNSTEFPLSSVSKGAITLKDSNDDGKIEIPRQTLRAAILGYVGGESPLFEFDNVVALKVTGKVGKTSIENTMLIKLGCNTAVNTLPVSACATMLPVVDMPVMQYPPRCCKCLNKKP